MYATSERTAQQPMPARTLARRRPVLQLVMLLLAACMLSLATARARGSEAQSANTITTPAAPAETAEIVPPRAPVELDGATLFRVRGISSYPAKQRAAAIAVRIEQAAADAGLAADDIGVRETDLGTAVMAQDRMLVLVTDADAKVEGIGRTVLARAYAARIRDAIGEYRDARTPQALTTAALRSGAATLALAAALALLLAASRRIERRLDSRTTATPSAVRVGSFELIGADHLGRLLRATLHLVRLILAVAALFVWLQYVLSSLPWTRGAAARTLDSVLDPLQSLGRAFVTELPSLVFLAVVFVLVRYSLKLVHLFFAAVGRADVSLRGFEPEWADPTYKLVRVAIVAFALIVAYPYVPGSQSDAFKGITIFLGIVFSLGSSSAIANMIAGYLLTYRRAFKVGDRVRIGEVAGDVVEMRLQVTHLKTVKNEEVTVPNSTILGSEVVNYSSYARREGLILHTELGIGYDTPWRKVEAMLLQAAARVPGLLTVPPPFVREKQLGEFAVTYELNAYSADAQQMASLYSELHRSILDVFNEYGVQIMTPAYEGDPERPKVVAREDWYAEPASVPVAAKAGGSLPASSAM